MFPCNPHEIRFRILELVLLHLMQRKMKHLIGLKMFEFAVLCLLPRTAMLHFILLERKFYRFSCCCSSRWKFFLFKIAKHESFTRLQKFSQQTAKVKCDEFMSFNFELFNERVAEKFRCFYSSTLQFEINLNWIFNALSFGKNFRKKVKLFDQRVWSSKNDFVVVKWNKIKTREKLLFLLPDVDCKRQLIL